MKLEAVGTNLIVEVEEVPQKETSSFIVCEDKPLYTRGKVVSARDMTSFVRGVAVIFLTEKGRTIGLGFPPSLVIVNEEDVHAVVKEGE